MIEQVNLRGPLATNPQPCALRAAEYIVPAPNDRHRGVCVGLHSSSRPSLSGEVGEGSGVQLSKGFLAFVATMLAAGPLLGAEREATGRWSFQLELTSRYDSNITQLSDTDRDRLQDPACTSTPLCASRYRIESSDDFIVVPSARLGWSHRSAREVETSLRGEARANRYARNSIKDYETYALRLSQELTAARRYETTFVLRAEAMPGFYLRELSVPEATRVQGSTVRDSAQYSSVDYEVALRQVLVPRHLEAEIARKRDSRDYDSPFDERDGDLSGWEAELTWSPAGSRAVSLRAGYRSESYDAAGDRPETIAGEPDISSDRQAVTAGFSFSWVRRGRSGWLSFDVEREARDFLSRDPTDSFHFDREDTRTEERLSFRQPLGDRLYIEAGLEHERNDSDLLPGASSPTGDEVTDFTRDVVSATIGWRI